MVTLLEGLFWVLLGLVFYTYIGYGVVLGILVYLKRLFSKTKPSQPEAFLPEVTLVVACFNELGILNSKIQNCKELNYPEGKLKLIFAADGSNDGSEVYLRENHPEILTLHKPARAGKVGAMNHAMQFADTDIVIFCDADSMLNKDAIIEMIKPFSNPKVGCAGGEKRIIQSEEEAASGAGEGLYWKYESLLKKWDAEFNTVVGVAGELFAIRKSLFQPFKGDEVLDDFMLSLKVAKQGYKVDYIPTAYASEKPVIDLKDEFKRKIRICSGGIQSIMRLLPLLNFFQYGWLSFQYISHRVLRWTLTPIALFLLLPLNLVLLLFSQKEIFFVTFVGQFLFYMLAYGGFATYDRKVKIKAFFVPFYFLMMNYTAILGMRKYFAGQQTVLWDKAKR